LRFVSEPNGNHAHLDPRFRRQPRMCLRDSIWAATDCTIVFVTHSLQEAIQLADRIVVLGNRPGRIIAEFENDLPRARHEIDDPRRYAQLMSELREAIGLIRPAGSGRASAVSAGGAPRSCEGWWSRRR